MDTIVLKALIAHANVLMELLRAMNTEVPDWLMFLAGGEKSTPAELFKLVAEVANGNPAGRNPAVVGCDEQPASP